MTTSTHTQHTRKSRTPRHEPKIDVQRNSTTRRVGGDGEQQIRRRTVRSEKLSEPPSIVELLAEQFAACTHYIPHAAHRVRTPDDLPPALERIAMCAQRSARTWLAWTAEPRTWFLVAERAKASGRACRAPALRMFFYDADGQPVASGTWVREATRGWSLLNPQ